MLLAQWLQVHAVGPAAKQVHFVEHEGLLMVRPILPMNLDLAFATAGYYMKLSLRSPLQWHTELQGWLSPSVTGLLQPAQMASIESPMGGGKAWPSLGDTRDSQKKTRSLPASPAKPAPLVPLCL